MLAQNRRSETSTRIVALTAGEVSGEWEFEKDVITVGRGAGADVSFRENKKISRLHCVFEVRADGVWVKDANSVNGTWLNNRRITEARVLPEDLVSVAGIRFRVMAGTRLEEKTPAEESEASQSPAFFSAAPAAEAAPAPKEFASNVVPFRAAVPAAPLTVDADRTRPEINPDAPSPEVELPQPELPQETLVTREPELAPQAPAFYVGGKRRPASGARPAAAPSQGLTSGQKLAIVLVLGGVVVFGGMLLVAGTIAWMMFGG